MSANSNGGLKVHRLKATSQSQSISIDGDQTFILGIDVGTTSVKVCLLDSATKNVVALQSKDTQASVPSECGSEGNKQDIPKICSTLHNCVTRLPRELLKRVVYIGICGQMHGVVLWKSGKGWDRSGDKVDPCETSNLYTWQDSRCTKEFIGTLPKPDSHLSVNTGYGCATLFWMTRHKPEKLERFDRAATIQDFIVAMLCEAENPVKCSVQNAASWGYFNTVKKEWNVDILKEAGFPVSLLPIVVSPGECAGRLVAPWHVVPEGTPVGVALGDFQCSVVSTLQSATQAILNISTSAQLAFVMKDGFQPTCDDVCTTSPDSDQNRVVHARVEYFPYFDGKYLAVAAALTGGNALAAFVRMLQQWALDLGCHVPQSKIWTSILQAGEDANTKSRLEVMPTIFGERHAPDQNASVSNIDLGNISLGQVTRALCRGIIQNLHGMMPRSMLLEAGIDSIIGSGSALSRNPILQQEFLEIFQLETHFGQGGDAAHGAALAMSKNL